MKILICLAMSCGLTAILYFYLKQRLAIIESRLNTLTDLAQTLAGELYQRQKGQLDTIPQVNESENESEGSTDSESEGSEEADSGSESDSESDSEHDLSELIIEPDISEPIFKEVKLEFDKPIIEVEEPILVLKQETAELIEVSDDETNVKQVSVDTDFSQFSLKELKQKVNDLGGPPLKTKQALINFLKKKV